MHIQRITSVKNRRVRRVQALQRSARRRAADGRLVVEGSRLMQEALRSSLPLETVFFTADFVADEGGAEIVAEVQEREVLLFEVSSPVMIALADTKTPQGILAVLPVPHLPIASDSGLVLVPDGVRDPGNLGTMLRTAWAAGCQQVLLPPGSVDWTNPKVVRAGMGAHFFLPTRRVAWPEIQTLTQGTAVWVAEAQRGTAYSAVNWCDRVTLIVGGEAAGAGKRARALPGARYVYIPMASGVESLNVAIATAVLLFESARYSAAFCA